eukprot:gnl/MRDRNA2_/MRDRNA2_126298_c0_seq1.p1 gnl/MRDRNA2_/MRDRNA2_126298_c0~~gnl/MRDRNA2_/MRDRNA2_126298_c0_seq1.p1  ORF type:complete len:452 (+),score=88.66 gnl/MRDRNA2_/MRDRNA2_126298_c0_seq1:90-1358(+)
MSLMVLAINDILTETVYMAEMARLHCSVSSKEYGFDLHVGGYHHKVPVLLQVLIDQLLDFRDSSKWDKLLANPGFTKRVEAQRQELLRAYRNAYLKPGAHCAALRRSLMLPHELLAPDKAKALAGVSLEDLRSWSVKALDEIAVDVLFQGNMAPNDADSIAAELRGRLCRGSPQPPKRAVLRIPEGMTYCVMPGQDTANKNCCVELYLQWLPRNLERLAIVNLLADLMYEPLFDELRTKQQLGYSVSCGARESVHVCGLSITVQSATHAPAEILKLIDSFLSDWRTKLESMEQSKFEAQRYALAAAKLEPIRSLASAQSIRWGTIVERLRAPDPENHVFDRGIREAVVMQNVEKKQVLAAFDEFVLHSAARRALTVVVIGGRHASSVDQTKADIEAGYGGSKFVSGPEEMLGTYSFWEPEQL